MQTTISRASNEGASHKRFSKKLNLPWLSYLVGRIYDRQQAIFDSLHESIDRVTTTRRRKRRQLNRRKTLRSNLGANIEILEVRTLMATLASFGLNNSATGLNLTGTGAYFTGNAGAGDRPASAPQAIEGTHSYGVTNGTATIRSNSIDTSGFTNLSLTFRLASLSIASTGNGADSNDTMIVAISADGGSTFTNVLTVAGNSNAFWSFGSGLGTATTPFNTPATFNPAGGGSRTTDGFSTISVTALPAVSNLQFRITMLNNATGERWLVDDIVLTGDPVGNVAPTVTSQAATLVTGNSATLNGNVTSDGGTALTDRGFVYSLSSEAADPIIGGPGVIQVANAGQTGAFSSIITGLTGGSSYKARAYAINAQGTTYSNVVSFTTATPGVTVVQSGGNTSVTEGGATDTYTLALATAPTGNVSITVNADSQTEVSTDGVNFSTSAVLTFNSTTAQTVTVRAINDTVVEGAHTGTITHSITATADPTNYPTSLAIASVTANITDNDFVSLVAPQTNNFETVAGPAGLGLGWTVVSVDTDAVNTWAAGSVTSPSADRFAAVNGFGDTAAANDWLISPPFNLDETANEAVSFETWTQFTDIGTTAPAVRFLYSTNYSGLGSPALATWTELPYSSPAANSQVFTSSGSIDVSSITGSQVWFAFRYSSSGTTGTTSTSWRVDDFSIGIINPDLIPPSVLTLSPADGSTAVAVNSNLVLTFDEPIAKGIGNIVIRRVDDNTIVQTIAVSDSAVTVAGAVATINPADFPSLTALYVTIDAGAFTDTASALNPFAGISVPTAWDFTTVAVDTTAPTVVSLAPADDATGVSASANLVITFNEPIAKGTGNIEIRRVSDDSVVQTIAVSNAAVTVSGAVATINPPTNLAFGTAHYVVVPAGAFTDTSPALNPFGGISGPTTWSFTTFAPATNVFINEVDSDTPGTDTAEFVELFGAPNTALDGLVLIFFNGSDDRAYSAIDLDGFSLNESGYFVIGNSAVVNVGLVFSDSLLQNGADAVALYAGDATDFPTTASVTTTNLIDAVVYDTNDADDSGLLILHLAGGQVDEGTNGLSSIARVPNGGTLRDSSNFFVLPPTPGATNFVPVTPVITVATLTKVYDGEAASAFATADDGPGVAPAATSGFTYTYYAGPGLTGGTIAPPTNVGDYSVAVAFAGSPFYNPVPASFFNFSITPRPLTISSPTIASRPFDGTTTAGAVTVGTLSNLVGAETVTVSGVAADYNSANAGSYTTTVTYTLASGTGLASNYTLAQTSGVSGVITKAQSTITTLPTASAITTGQALSASTLSGGAASPSGGTFIFQNPSSTPVATGFQTIVYTPVDTLNFEVASGSVEVVVNPVVTAPTLNQVIVNGGDSFLNPLQRSQVTSILLSFSAAITLAQSDITIANLGLLAAQTPVALAANQIVILGNGTSQITLRWGTGSGVDSRGGSGARGNSLSDGNWRLTIAQSKVTGNNTFGATAADNFFRMYGDGNGDGRVDAGDSSLLRAALAAPAVNAAYDWDGNGSTTSGVDTSNFGTNLGRRRRLF